MKRSRRMYRLSPVVVASLIFAGCGLIPQGDSQGGYRGEGTVSELADVQSATVQITGTGSFRNPDEAVGLETNVVGNGSGFIIDPSGVEVTNNHVFTGMASLEVFVNDESYNAKVLGASECSDLAVIDIEGGGWEFEGETIGAGVGASTDLAAYQDRWDVPGMSFGASESLAGEYETGGLLDYFDYSDSCDYDARYDYEDAACTGAYDL